MCVGATPEMAQEAGTVSPLRKFVLFVVLLFMRPSLREKETQHCSAKAPQVVLGYATYYKRISKPVKHHGWAGNAQGGGKSSPTASTSLGGG